MRPLFAFAMLVTLALTGNASAQFGQVRPPNYGPGYRNNISPALNLLRGQNLGIDYYLGTRAEQQRRVDAREFRNDINDIRNTERLPVEEDEEPFTSGTGPAVNNTRGYFNNTYGYYPSTQQRRPGGQQPAPASRSRRR